MADGGWNEWREHVLEELRRAYAEQQAVRKDLQQMSVQIAQLKVRAGIWGAVAGAIPPLMLLLLRLL